MNSLEILQRIRNDVNNSKHWLDGTPCEPALVNMETRLLGYADELRKARDERLAAITANGPRAYKDENGTLIIVLLRDGKEVNIDLSEFDVDVVFTEETSVRQDLRLKDPPDADGRTYFIYATPTDFGMTPFGVQITKEEATLLRKAIRATEEVS